MIRETIATVAFLLIWPGIMLLVFGFGG